MKEAVLAFILKALVVGPFAVFSRLLDIPFILFIVYPTFNCILYIIISNLHGSPVKGKVLYIVFAVSLFITFIVKQLVTSCIIQVLTLLGLECIIIFVVDLLVQFVVVESLLAPSIPIRYICNTPNIFALITTIGVPVTVNHSDGTKSVFTQSSGWEAVNKRAEPTNLEEVYDKNGNMIARIWYEEVANRRYKIQASEDHE